MIRRHDAACPHLGSSHEGGLAGGSEPASAPDAHSFAGDLSFGSDTGVATEAAQGNATNIAGLHWTGSMPEDELIGRLRHAVDAEDRRLPLPMLLRPLGGASR